MIRQVQAFAKNPDVRNANQVAKAFGLSHHTARKYLSMTEDMIQALDCVKPRGRRPSQASDYLNIIYKMQRDGYRDGIIFHYVMRKGYEGSGPTLASHIYNISSNNFPGRKRLHYRGYMEWRYPADVTVIRRSDLLKYILTVNPRTGKDRVIGENIGIIKEAYPVVETTERMFKDFHSALMGDDPEAIGRYVAEYAGSGISGFCDGIMKDIVPVRNAVLSDVSSGVVEGCNNKFKLIKRTLYGRAGLGSLTKKCKLAFAAKDPDFSLADLL